MSSLIQARAAPWLGEMMLTDVIPVVVGMGEQTQDEVRLVDSPLRCRAMRGW